MSETDEVYSEQSERLSDTSEQERDYVSDRSSSSGSVKNINDRYTNLLDKKFWIINNYYNGNMDSQQFNIEIRIINQQLEETEYDRENIEQKIINREIQLSEVFDTYEAKIKQNIPLTAQEIKTMKDIKKELEILYNNHKQIDEDFEPIPSNKFYEEWDMLQQLEKEDLERWSGMTYPVRSLFKTNEEFVLAQEKFLDDISLFLNSYWETFEHEEETELLTLAKNLNLGHPPKKTEKAAYKAFLTYVRQHLPYGYVYKSGTTKANGKFEKLDVRTLKQKFLDHALDEAIVPIVLTADEQMQSEKLKLYYRLLEKLSDEHLRSCILKVKTINQSAKPMRQEPEPEASSLIRKSSGKPIPKKQLITGRKSAKQKLIKAFKDVPDSVKRYLLNDVLVDNVKQKVDLLEESVFRYTKTSPQDYYNKINQLVFIFEHYPDFKIKFLQGWINVYQLVLFEKTLLFKGVTEIYPTTVKNRTNSIQQIFKELYIGTYDPNRPRASDILTKIQFKKKSKEIELFIFNISQNERQYADKIKQIVNFIRKGGNVFVPIEQIVYIQKNKPVVKVDYDSLSYNEANALLLQEQNALSVLEKQKRLLEAKNFNGVNVINWKPGPTIPSVELQEWYSIIKKMNSPANAQSNIQIYLMQLDKIHVYLVQKYRLDVIPGLSEIKKKIETLSDKVKKLEDIVVKKKIQEYEKIRSAFLTHVGVLMPPSNKQEPRTYPVLQEETVYQLINTIKRTLLNMNPELLELYDLNEEYTKKRIKHGTKEVPVITKDVYEKIKKYLLSQLPQDFAIKSKAKGFEAVSVLTDLLGMEPLELTTINNAVKEITRQFPAEWNGEKFLDIYGENIFEKLYKNPLSFYKLEREYNQLVKKFTPEQEKIYTKPHAKFEGKWYPVEFLDKDWTTGKPSLIYKKVLEKNPRTQSFEVVEKVTVRNGKFPYILRKLRTSQEGVEEDSWIEIPPSRVVYKTVDFGRKKNKKVIKWKNIKSSRK